VRIAAHIHPDLKTGVQPREMNVESAAMNGSMPVERHLGKA
jgi:hypothetical protein